MKREQFTSRTTFSTGNARLKIKRQQFADGTEGVTLQGYAIVWGEKSSDRGGYSVKLAPKSAKFTDSVMALWHHDFSRPLGGTVNKTLRILAADDIGVPVEIDLDMNTSAGRDCAANVGSGLVGGMSFSMANGFEDYTEEKTDGKTVLNVTKYTVDEVTVTPIPAFAGTSVGTMDPDEDEEDAEDVEEYDDDEEEGGMAAAAPNRITASHEVARAKLFLSR